MNAPRRSGQAMKAGTECRAAAMVCLVAAAIVGCKKPPPESPYANTPVTPATHTRFPIVTGAHALDCNNCHGGLPSFSDFTCVSCHPHDQPTCDAVHGGVPGYIWGSAACYSCHPDGGKKPFATLVSDPKQDVQLTALIPTYIGSSISSVTAQVETLPMNMNHATTALGVTDLSTCATCHPSANAGVYYPGALHSSLAVAPFSEPTLCSDCHAVSAPTGFVGPTATSPARSPASGEMKHDAVAWSTGIPTTTSLVPQDCGICHIGPSQTQSSATWATSLLATSPARFHAALASASQAQPASCVDCHANSRPNAVLTSGNATLPANLQFDHTSVLSLADCGSCHSTAATSGYVAWSGGQFHLSGSASPTTCVPCHAGERPLTTSGWTSSSYTASPFDYVTNTNGIAHGDGQDCAVCHSGPGTGAWGGTQNWVNGHFPHGSTTVADTTCIACHTSQRPTTIVSSFDHSLNGTGDCFGCHQATVTANTYLHYVNPGTGTLPGGDWQGGQSYPGSTLVGAPNQFITENEIKLNRSGSHNLVTSTSTTLATLYNEMLHVSVALPPQLSPGPTGSPDYSKCWHCHTSSNGVVTSYADGEYHPSLASYTGLPDGGSPQPFPQPTTQCFDCHTQMRPVNIVEKNTTVDLQPMDHNALFTATVTIGGQSVNSVTNISCSNCHHSPGNTWTDGVFHANITTAVPQDCAVCHYTLMADAPKSDLTSGAHYSMRHATTQLTFQTCPTCHTTAFAKAATTPAVSTLWQGATYHANLASQPAACVDCHTVSEPSAGASTQSAFVYSLSLGATSTNGAQWMNHGSSQVVGKDCVVCHAADAKTSGALWSKSDSFHAAVTSPNTCQACHGTANGGGTAIGTNNNYPVGLTNSSVLTSASSDSTTGIPIGTPDQITHADVNTTSHDCNFCHTQVGPSSVNGIHGKEWARANFHLNINAANPLILNGTTGRCSNCHMNVKPVATFTGQDHSSFSDVSGTQDCNTCHTWPGTGTASAPNWLGASGVPALISVGGFAIPQPPASSPTTQAGISNLPHPTVGTGVACTACHATSGGGKGALGYDHASALINSNCSACHQAGSNLVGTVWNGATSQSSGAGDTLPFTLTSVTANKDGDQLHVTYPNHFYPVDCHECHTVPAGDGLVTTGSAYTSAWNFPHQQSKMTNPSTCVTCHTNGIPD